MFTDGVVSFVPNVNIPVSELYIPTCCVDVIFPSVIIAVPLLFTAISEPVIVPPVIVNLLSLLIVLYVLVIVPPVIVAVAVSILEIA